MLVKDIMTTNVVTVASSTPALEARKIMEAHNIERLPVVDRGKLVGMVTKNLLRRAGPSEATSLSVWEINYLIAKMTVKEVMKKEVVAIPPDVTVECAVATAQTHRVGALPVLEDNRLVGILTTNDFFYKILNPLLGVNEEGTRITVYGADTAEQICKVMEAIKSEGIGVKVIHTIAVPEAASRDLIVHLDTQDISKVVSKLRELGFHVDERQYGVCQA